MEKTQDWSSVITPKVLLVGENSTLQWSDEIVPYVMFLDYFFDVKPYDLGERSRFTEAKLIFEHINKLTAGWCNSQSVYATNISLDQHTRPPKGKHLLVPESSGKDGVERIKKILKENPSIRFVFVMDMQPNYYLQKFGLYDSGTDFVRKAEPRRAGMSGQMPYYQPVDAKAYSDICGKFFAIKDSEVKVIPILAARDYPLSPANMDKYGDIYISVQKYFEDNIIK